ncbi:MAG: hypothetical protein NDJ90_15670 [Oligoflexia bacterium]|nr:hypothetical protein [Oligoflexia bacterium]
MKIAVYAIALNEEKFAQRRARCCAEASSDHTVELLQAEGVEVHRERIEPWRYDSARNRSLDPIPADVDVCIALDLDEVLAPGWRQALEAAWTPETTLLRYPFITDWSPGDSCTACVLLEIRGSRGASPAWGSC